MLVTHPLTGRPIAAVGFRNPRASRGEVGLQPIFPIMGGSDAAPPPGQGAPAPTDAEAAATAAAAKAKADADAKTKADADAAAAAEAAKKAGAGEDGKTDAERGYPLKTAVEDMTDPQQAAYWKAYARKHEGAFQKLAGKEMTPEKIAELVKAQEDAAEAAKTETQRLVDAARKEGEESARAGALEGTVKALIDAHVVAAKLDAVKDADVLETFGTLNHSSFVGTDGHIDAVKLSKVLNRLAPVGGGGQQQRTWPATGQGNRNDGTGSVRDAGHAEAERRGYRKPAGSTT